MENRLTSGSIRKNVLRFSLPYFLSYFLQTLYGMADLFIVGQFAPVSATTAVSNGSQVMHMLTVVIVGLSMGTTVTIGQSIGAADRRRAAKAIGSTIFLFSVLSLLLTGILLALAGPIVTLISTPAQAAAGTRQYLTICFLGIPFITAYNSISSVFRGLGDSKSPMYFIAVACGVNILLDYLLIGALGLGPVGAALGTTLSQAVSVVVSLWMIRRKNLGIDLTRQDLHPNSDVLGQILRIGVPVAIQDGFIQISFLFITVIANHRGMTDAAAVGIVEKMIGFLFLVPSSMLSTVSALGAQNIGAGKPDRAVATMQYAIGISCAFGLAASILVQFWAEPFVSLFTPDRAVWAAGGQYFRGYIWDCFFAGVHFCFSGYFCARGKSGLSFLHNFLSIVLVRLPGAYLAYLYFPHTLLPMGLASAAGSVLSILVCFISYLTIRRRDKKLA